ncbi:hypothetical protein LX15_003401 [Streptoalloteichus tenebrarius]|uniref:PPE family domain-containing protein n=1 Tax=Streptoalloteichus tenebrarius (strain ATCC 17920 / DSM 40477 / JCM 4838 / CBS 697.72 / NBRC 16177 / NCIMB 11028 / NRRL B-12390 / A12253. 1 / ISP 5477) TaxID=1933 RepID=A0ABT1HVZ0_STRSD|nr:hypothetical protein [Streptoalloteichus tenebrarius]MCP2259695.1 hypothetical protein [Streptoalloteichus tenebrarius]BFF00672.1 hypothetical protein GCM10020241_23470 [Streptoalloteichus tenebrarius]
MYFGVGYYRYEGFDLETKVRWVKQEGAGLSVLQDNADAVRGLTEALYQSENNLRRVLGQINVAWEGSAADAATTAMTRAAKWATESGDTGAISVYQVNNQMQAASFARHDMPEVVAKPEYGMGDLAGDTLQAGAKVFGANIDVQTNFDKQVAARREADKKANSVLREYESSSRAVLAGIEPILEPPKITVETADSSTPPPPSSVDSWQSDRTTGRNTTVSPQGDVVTPPNRVSPPPVAPPDGNRPPAITPPTNFPPPVRVDPLPEPRPLPTPTPPPPGGGPSPTPVPVPPPGFRPPGGGWRPGEAPGRQGGGPGRVPVGPGVPGGDRAGGGGRSGGVGGGPRGGMPGGGVLGAGGAGEAHRGSPFGRGPLSGGVIGEAGPGARGGVAGGAAGGAGRGGSIMQPAVGGAHGAGARGEEDGEHTDKYAEQTDEHFLDNIPLVAPPVIGGNPPGQP